MPVQSTLRNLARGEGAYRTGARTGVVGTTLAAGSGTAGHVWACRFTAGAAGGVPLIRQRRAIIQRFRAKIMTVAGFTAAQEVAFDLFKATAFTALHTGGNAVTPSKKVTVYPATLMTARIASTAELTAGTHTFDTDPIAGCSWSELATGAAVPKGAGGDIFLSTEDLTETPIVLAPDEGLILRNVVAFGGGGTVRLVVEMDWLEVERF